MSLWRDFHINKYRRFGETTSITVTCCGLSGSRHRRQTVTAMTQQSLERFRLRISAREAAQGRSAGMPMEFNRSALAACGNLGHDARP